MKTEIVEIEGYYAIRRSYRKFGIFPTCDFASLTNRTPYWHPRNYDYFNCCLSKDLDKVRCLLAEFGYSTGTPILGNEIINSIELFNMHKIAKTDEGMADVLLKAKEYYLLKRK